jgi:LacI family transcriptional regulator
MAIGFLQTVTAAGRRVPEDVSVIGFDNIVDAGLVDPGLTTIAAPLVSLGTTAVAYLATRRNLETETREPVLLPARLVLRGSTGPRPG